MFQYFVTCDEVYTLVFVENIVPGNSGKLDEYLDLVRVMHPVSHSGYLVIEIDEIQRTAHLIPDSPMDATNDSWVVNSHIDVRTWNKVYEWT